MDEKKHEALIEVRAVREAAAFPYAPEVPAEEAPDAEVGIELPGTEMPRHHVVRVAKAGFLVPCSCLQFTARRAEVVQVMIGYHHE